MQRKFTEVFTIEDAACEKKFNTELQMVFLEIKKHLDFHSEQDGLYFLRAVYRRVTSEIKSREVKWAK